MGELEIPSDLENDSMPNPEFEQISANREQRTKWYKEGIFEQRSDELWCCSGMTYSTKIAVEANKGKSKCSFEEMVPKEYHTHKKVFSEEESHQLPKHQPWDHTIDLKSDAPETIKSKVYPMP